MSDRLLLPTTVVKTLSPIYSDTTQLNWTSSWVVSL